MSERPNILEALARRMDWLSQRQSVLARNIANADTPAYKPEDLKQGPFARLLARRPAPLEVAATDPKHLAGGRRDKGAFDSAEDKHRYETAPSGNAVIIEEQLVKVAETQMDYQAMSNLYRKHLQMLRTALGRGS